MDLSWSEAEDAFRDEARAWLTHHLAAWHERHGGPGHIASGDTREGLAQHLDWERDLHAGRWAAVSWPPELGGRGASLWEWLIFEEEYYRAGCPPGITQNGIFLPSLVTDDPAAVALAFDRGAFGAAALLVGLGQRMLDLTVAHVAERHQFGVPVGSFQAVKHDLADGLKGLALARPAVHRAAHSLATGAGTRGRDVSMAKALASDAAWRVGRRALQCHGAVGYTVEHDLHLYLKRTWALARAWGDAAWHRDRVAALGVWAR
jgi:alkylation response protein AidB-like acyl-CoA dehydrogenase